MNKPYIIGVTGGSGSGKTRFIKEIYNHFTEEQVCLVSQDNYYRPRNLQPVDKNGFHNFDEPDSMDLDKMVTDIKNLIQGEMVTNREYTYNNPLLPGNPIRIKSAPVILLEGIFIMHHPDLRNLLDLKIFVHAMEHIMLSRRILRDEQERGYDLEDVLYRYRHHVMPSFRKYILPYKDNCDIVVNNNEEFDRALHLLTVYIENLLQNYSS